MVFEILKDQQKALIKILRLALESTQKICLETLYFSINIKNEEMDGFRFVLKSH